MNSSSATENTFKLWDRHILFIANALYFFKEEFKGVQRTPEEDETIKKAKEELLAAADEKFYPEVKTRPRIEKMIGRFARLCDVMVKRYAEEENPEFGFENIAMLISIRVMMAGLPPRKTLEDMPKHQLQTKAVYDKYNDYVKNNGASMLDKIRAGREYLQ
jgi:hypothetical protein